eukprot:gene1601-1773_t
MQAQLGATKKPLDIPFTLLMEGDRIRQYAYQMLQQWKKVTTDHSGMLLQKVHWIYNSQTPTAKVDEMKREVRSIVGKNVSFHGGMDIEFLSSISNCVVVIDHILTIKGEFVPIIIMRGVQSPKKFLHFEVTEE